LRRRLWLERQLDVSDFALAALDEALALLPGAAFVVELGGRIVHANPAGRRTLAEGGKGTRERVAASVRAPERDGPFTLIPLAARGAPDYLLAIARAGTPREGADPALLARRWGLTARQTQVLALLLRGYANRSIAADLQCALNTVEHHVTAVLAKAGVDSRAELIALATASP
jgi:DNA-binding CsgD family transcriptional regulator